LRAAVARHSPGRSARHGEPTGTRGRTAGRCGPAAAIDMSTLSVVFSIAWRCDDDRARDGRPGRSPPHLPPTIQPAGGCKARQVNVKEDPLAMQHTEDTDTMEVPQEGGRTPSRSGQGRPLTLMRPDDDDVDSQEYARL